MDDSTTTVESPESAKTAPITNTRVTFRNPIYTTLYVPKEEIDSPASAKTAPVNAKVTTQEPVYTTLYCTPQANKRKSSSGVAKFVDGKYLQLHEIHKSNRLIFKFIAVRHHTYRIPVQGLVWYFCKLRTRSVVYTP